ncbi:chemotaxis protein CheB [Calothrix sp. 336/3]|uniref:chemotaxis protein CheB n=1 Tax=Calothrix sp. 336/3 TaxID=1337936 RepID=UPI0004E413C5|nr:chemotaxis protein CheB [Calothrix sp. 336/3]AKG23953.1 chemotaxis protein [Calothrix sp. 336/3]
MNFKLIVIGTSFGGLEALKILISPLPKTFSIPLAVVIHRHKESDDSLVKILQKNSSLIIKEVEDKEDILPGYVYLAPANYHLLIEKKLHFASKIYPQRDDFLPNIQTYFSLSIDAPVSYARPAIDVLFETAADCYGEKLIAIILTGANQDGVNGMRKIKGRGGLNVVQEPKTALCATMPTAAIAAGITDKILSLTEIPPFLIKMCHQQG